MNMDKKMSVDDAKFRIQEKAKLTDDEVRYLTYYRRSDSLILRLAQAMK